MSVFGGEVMIRKSFDGSLNYRGGENWRAMSLFSQSAFFLSRTLWRCVSVRSVRLSVLSSFNG